MSDALDLAGPVTVVGAGASGLAAANVLAARTAQVTLVEASARPRPAGLDPRVDYRADTNAIPTGDLVVLSPGVTEVSPLRALAAARGRAVIGELELFARLCPAPIHAITGTDGKSTVTTMLGAIFAATGAPTIAGGNLGTPLCALLDEITGASRIAAEVSAFQLTTCDRFRPRTASVTNIADDHVDYHGTHARYLAAKQRVSRCMGAGDTLILNRDDPVVAAWPIPPGATVRWCSLRGPADGWFDGTWLRLRDGEGDHPWLRRDELALAGLHNVANALIAGVQATAAGVPPAIAAKALRGYRALAHRIELVAERGGVRWFDDSKATNPHAASAALRAINGPIVLLVGGASKGVALDAFAALVRARARRVIAFGQARAELAAAIGPDRVGLAATLAEAVAIARAIAVAGDAVLLSPACASFDEFESYAHRGDAFAALARAEPA
jgi:UDP-N-acetylmuramoylalanine--D-glutamate ligase